ncbi:MAG: MBG domain-containing protein, partial [Actinomycetota bacterium]
SVADRTISCTGAAALNYAFSYPSGTITVQKKQLTVTATSHTVTYGDPRPTVTPLSYTGWVNDQDETTVAITGLTCGAATYTIASSATTTPATTCSGATATDYSFAYVNGAITILTKALTITASSPSVTYGDPVPAVTPAYSGLANAETASDLTTPARCTTAYTVSSGAGTTPATSCSGATSPNYTIGYVAGAVTIARRTVPVTATTQTVTYGEAAATLRALPTVEIVVAPASATPLTLQAQDGIWTGAAGEGTTRQWQSSTDGGATWSAIGGATAATYIPPTADIATRAYRVVVTYTQTDASTLSVASAGRRYAVFADTGGLQTWTVPTGVTSAVIDLVGARGGQLGTVTSSGGLGGRIQGVVPVTPNAVLNVYVGRTTTSTTGGYNGGGAGRSVGSGGGGATDVRTGGTALTGRVLVAGGGGGQGGTDGGTPHGNHGGAGGGLVAAGGSAKVETNSLFRGGGGGTQAAGGEAGLYCGVACAAAGASGTGGAACTTSTGGGGG